MKWAPLLVYISIFASGSWASAAVDCGDSSVASPEEFPWKYLVIVAEPSAEAEELQAAVNSIPGVFVKAKFDGVLRAIFAAHQHTHKLNGNGFVRADRKVKLKEPMNRKPDWYNVFSIQNMDRRFNNLLTAFLSPPADACPAQTVGYRDTDASPQAFEQITSLLRLEKRTGVIFLDNSPAPAETTGQRRSLRGRFELMHDASLYHLTAEDVASKSDQFKGVYAFLGSQYPQAE